MTRPRNNAELLDHLAENPEGDFIGELLAQERAAARQGDGQARFWQQLYAAHPYLRDHHQMVDGILRRDLARLGKMEVNAAISELGRMATAELDHVAKEWNSPGARDRRIMRGSPTHGQSFADGPDPGSNVLSVTDIIKRRKAKRYEARHNPAGRKVAAE